MLRVFCVLLFTTICHCGGDVLAAGFGGDISVSFLLQGTNASLPCGYDQPVNTVSWYRGSLSSKDSLLIHLNNTVIGGEKGGPEYAAGRVDISDDFSLIIYGVRMRDDGFYTCVVTNNEPNITLATSINVTVVGRANTAVTTVESVDAVRGTETQLPCSYKRDVSSVNWYKGSVPSNDTRIVTLRRISGRSMLMSNRLVYNESIFNVTDEFALVIKSVTLLQEGRYTCQVHDRTLGMSFYNYTDVKVTVYAAKPYVRITQCALHRTRWKGNSDELCIADTRGQDHLELDCLVLAARPKVSLSWMQHSLAGSAFLKSDLAVTENIDGTFNIRSTVELKNVTNGTLFTCKAEGLAVNGTATKTILLLRLPINKLPRPSDVNPLIIIIPIVTIAIVVGISLIIWRHRRQYRSVQSEDQNDSALSALPLMDYSLRELRNEIECYIPSSRRGSIQIMNFCMHPVETDDVTIAAFLNSLHLAIKGKYQDIGKRLQGSKKTTSVRLTNFIRIWKLPGKASNVKENGVPDVVHCHFIICEYRKVTICESTRNVLRKKAEKIGNIYGEHVVAIIHRGPLPHAESSKHLLGLSPDIPDESVHMVQYYPAFPAGFTADVSVNANLLEFLIACINMARHGPLLIPRDKRKMSNRCNEVLPLATIAEI